MMSKKELLSIIIAIILFIMLSIFIKAGLTTNFEGWVYTEAVIPMSPIITNIVKVITNIGGGITVVTICLILFVFSKSRKTIAIPVSITVIVSFILSLLLKNAFARERPDILRLVNETSYSFPSAHAMINSALYTMLTYLTLKYIKNRYKKIGLITLFVTVTIAIGYSRVYLGVHYISDVAGGWLLGFTVATIVYSIFDRKNIEKKLDNVVQDSKNK